MTDPIRPDLRALIAQMAHSFAGEWLRPADPDAADPTLRDTLRTTLMAFYAVTSQAVARREAALSAPAPAGEPHDDRIFCSTCGRRRVAESDIAAPTDADLENQRRQLEALGLLDEFAPSCDLADAMGEEILRLRAQLAGSLCA